MTHTLGNKLIALCCFALAGLVQVHAAEPNNLKEVTAQVDGDRVFVRLEFEKPIAETPQGWKTGEPIRLVFDLPGVKNQSGKSNYSVNASGLRAVQLVQTDEKTRVLLSMYESRGYEVENKGNSLIIKLNPFTQTMTGKIDNVPSTIGSSRARLVEPAAVRDVVFRRGPEGQAQILIDLTDGSVPIDIRRSGTGVTVDIQNVVIPESLQGKRDVNDFATAVTGFTSISRGTQGRIDIAARGHWQHHAQLVNNQLKIEIRQLTAAETNRLVPIGQEGKKISVNFYEADLGMVLRTLAELSGRNVIVDPSLTGKKITVTLDNMPYDHAIDLVLSQSGAGLRLKPDVVIFGARDVLMKRDIDLADEIARANETAPLVNETFQLDYISATEAESLILVAQNESTTSQSATGGQSEGSSRDKKENQQGKPRGLLTARGIMTVHKTTNKLFVKDTQAVIDQIRQMLKEVDAPPRQVMIEARIVEVTTDFRQELGVRLRQFDTNVYRPFGGGTGIGMGKPWLGVERGVPLDYKTTGNTTAYFPSNYTNLDLFGAAQQNSPYLPTALSQGFGAGYAIPSTNATTFDLMLFNSAATKLLSIEIAAAESDTKGKTVSSPRVVTQNRKPAKIENELAITITTGRDLTTGLPILQTLKAPLSLEVTPSITPSSRVDLNLKVIKAKFLPGIQVGEYSVETNTLNSNVIVDNGGTVVIGGFYREEQSNKVDRVPFLGDLPYVGFLFKTTTEDMGKHELLVFITPRIVSDALALR